MIETAASFLHAILIITNTLAISLPPNIHGLSILLRINQRFHSLIIGRFGFNQINDIKLIRLILFRIHDLKKIPQRIITCPIIILEDQIILIF